MDKDFSSSDEFTFKFNEDDTFKTFIQKYPLNDYRYICELKNSETNSWTYCELDGSVILSKYPYLNQEILGYTAVKKSDWDSQSLNKKFGREFRLISDFTPYHDNIISTHINDLCEEHGFRWMYDSDIPHKQKIAKLRAFADRLEMVSLDPTSD